MLSELKRTSIDKNYNIIVVITTENKMGFFFVNGFHKRGQIKEWKDKTD